MKHSESIANLAAALIGAQAEIKTIGFDSVNPFFKSKYASLTTILETVRPILARHKLAVVQGASTPHTDHNGQLTAVSVESTLIHASGEWLTSGVIMPVGVTPIEKGSDVRLPTAQNAGAAVSFGRRYALAALLSLATDEDVDGNDTAPAPTHRTAAAPIANRAPSPVARPTAQPNGTSAPLAGVPNCPKCGNGMYDNRAENAERVAAGQKARPAFACKDKTGCKHVVWKESELVPVVAGGDEGLPPEPTDDLPW